MIQIRCQKCMLIFPNLDGVSNERTKFTYDPLKRLQCNFGFSKASFLRVKNEDILMITTMTRSFHISMS